MKTFPETPERCTGEVERSAVKATPPVMTPDLGPAATAYAAARAIEAAGRYVYLDCYLVGSVPATPKVLMKCKYSCGPEQILIIRTPPSGTCLGEDGKPFKMPVWVETAAEQAPAKVQP